MNLRDLSLSIYIYIINVQCSYKNKLFYKLNNVIKMDSRAPGTDPGRGQRGPGPPPGSKIFFFSI